MRRRRSLEDLFFGFETRPRTSKSLGSGVFQERPYLVMELLDGLDLETLVEKFGPLPPARAVYLLRQACESLEEAHARGLVHRDVKPSNIFSCRLGLAVDFVKVLDFGLVKAMGEGDRDATLLTAPDSTTGTPAFIAPELVRGDAVVDHRVDIYALGCVGYWLLTGRLVFEAPNAIQMLYQHANNDPVPPSRRSELDIPAELDSVILTCLAKHPDDRPHSAGELSRRLAVAVNGGTWSEERAHRWWDRHHPEAGKPEPTSEFRHLTKTIDVGWAPVQAPKPEMDPARSL